MDPQIERRAHRFADLLAALAATVAVLVMAGYVAHLPSLIRLHPKLQGMSPLTASATLALAVAVAAATRRRDRLVDLMVLFVIATVGTTLVGRLITDVDVVSASLARHLFATSPDSIGQMSTGTAMVLLLIAASLAGRRRPSLADWAAGAGLLVTGTALLGFFYGVDDLYALPLFATMALHTAIALTLLCVAALLVEPQVGWSSVLLSSHVSGGVTRRQLGLLLLPVVIGWVLREGTLSHQLGTGLALTLLVVLTIAPMALLVLRDGRAQLALEAERRDHVAAQASLARDLENQLARKAEQLERESAERSRIEEAMSRTHRVEAMGQLTGGIAHDFNNLLAAIGGNLELLLRKLPDEHAARRYAMTASAAVGKGAKLAGQLLAFSRSQRLTVQPTEIAPLIRHVRELIGTSLGPSVELLLEYPRDSVWALTDPDQLELALCNLAVNARDAMPGGGLLRIESDVRPARLQGGDEKPCVSIRVVDRGVGMAPEVLARAVEPFFTTRERGRGTGLGLAQVYGFVRQCGGDLVIDSAPGRGTTVEILLPQTGRPIAAPALRPAEPKAVDATTSARRRLLVVDDDDAVRAVLVELLGDAGYDITEAADGPSALAQIEALQPDAAVLDFLMPGMNGAEVARRAQAVVPNLPIVFVSGYSDTVALDSVAGAIVLRKPFHAEQLQAAVSAALRSRIA